MQQITTCSFLALLAGSVLVTPADANLIEILQGNPNATAADFAQSFVQYDQCIASGNSQQACYKILWDPDYITEGVMTVDVTPLNGDTSRIGRVLRVTFFNGYTGSGPFTRTDLGDRVRYEIPVVSVEPPPETEGLNIVELQVSDDGGGQAFFDFDIGARDVIALLDDGTVDDNPLIVPATELVAFNIDLTPAQAVPLPNVDGFQPLGLASLNISNIDPEDGNATISINGEISGLTSSPVGAMLRGPAKIGEIGETILQLDFSEEEGTFGINDAAIDGAALNDIVSGLTYLEVATEANDSGEIRGQIIPEPSSLSLLLLGLIPLGRLRPRR